MTNDKLNEAEETLNKLGYLISEGYKRGFEIHLEVRKNKDWTAAINYWEREIEKDTSPAYFYYSLGKAYDQILNDDVIFIKYAKKTYELDSTNSGVIFNYYEALLEGEKFEEAKILSHSENFKAGFNEKKQLENLWKYYYFKGNYKKAAEVLNDSLMGDVDYLKMLTYAQLGDRKKVGKFLNNYYSLYRGHTFFNDDMAITYAILKEKDSMYHYLEKLRPIAEFHYVNSRFEFNPYRKEERFKALLRKHYLPITHWNE